MIDRLVSGLAVIGVQRLPVARKIPRRERMATDPQVDPMAATQDVLERCKQSGFVLAGIAPVQGSAFVAELRAWIGAGKHGEMEWLARDAAVREEPARIMEGLGHTQAFIVVADQYASRQDVHGADEKADDLLRGKIARYARGRNYHDVMKRRLHALADSLRLAYPGSEFRTCVDTAPILERELATLAGLGWQAKNTLVINPGVGSYVLLGVVATTLPLLANSERVPDSCGTCTRCIDACPTRAITPYSVDATRCVSYLTIERRTPIEPALHAGLGQWIFGCDICQEVCPHNTPRPIGSDAMRTGEVHAAYEADRERDGLWLLDVLGWGEAERREAFKNSPMKRATLGMMRRNALVAMGNAIRSMRDEQARLIEADALRERIEHIAGDEREDPIVRTTAQQVLASLG